MSRKKELQIDTGLRQFIKDLAISQAAQRYSPPRHGFNRSHLKKKKR